MLTTTKTTTMMTTTNMTNATTTMTRMANTMSRTMRTTNTMTTNTMTTITMMTTTRTTRTMMTTMNTTTVTATAVGGKDNGCNSNGRVHRQQSTKIGSKDTVAVATAMETAAAGAPTTALGIGTDEIAFATAWEGCGCWL